MNLNNKIGWCDATWNVYHGCENKNSPCWEFCYARKLAEGRLKGRFGYENGFAPTFHKDRLQEPYKRTLPTRIFVSSMGDLFGEWVKEWWVSAIMRVVYDNPQHTFQFLTKFPHNVAGFMEFSHVPVLPKNMWIGTSVTCKDDLWRIDYIRKLRGGKRFVSFEPLLEEIVDPALSDIDWIIIGRETGRRKYKIVPQVKWITDISETASCKNIPVYMKHNLRPVYPEYSELRQEFPKVIR